MYSIPRCFLGIRVLVIFVFCAGTAVPGQVITAAKGLDHSNPKILDFYRQPGVMTQKGGYDHMLENLPDRIPDLCKIVQGVILHIFWAEAYDISLSEERKGEVKLRTFEQMLGRIAELDERPLSVARAPNLRVVGNCRDFSVFLCALLKYKGIPARARCGFGTYFVSDRYVDHWICEYWNVAEKRWVCVDAQLDSLQVATLKLAFDPHDLPPGKFLSGAEAWQLCRSGELDPDLFGIFDMKGLWFVQGDLVRDFMALNKMEVLPWDCTEIMGGPEAENSQQDYLLLDWIAALTVKGDPAFAEIRLLYESDERLRMPADWQP